MNVVFINTSDSNGGAAIACIRLQQALTKYAHVKGDILVQEKKTSNHAVTSIAPNLWTRQLVWLRFIAERLLFLPYEKSKTVRFLFNRSIIGTDVSQHPLVKNADIIHMHWINFGFLSIESLRKLFDLGKPVVWTFHDMWAFTGGCHHSGDCEHYQVSCGHCKFLAKPAENDISKSGWLKKKNVYFPNHFTAVGCSQWLTNRAKSSSLLQEFNIVAIPNPIDTIIFSPIAKSEAQKRLNLPENKHYILFAAMRVNAAGKGFDYFLKALNLLRANNTDLSKDVELIIFGDAEEEVLQLLPFPAHNLGRLTSTQQISLAYNAASIFVTPSLEENLPNTIMEAFACGTPAVGFKIGGIPEMIDHLQNGFLAEYRSVDSLAEGIQWVLNNNLEGRLSTYARHKAVNNYAEEVVAKQYYSLYQSLL